MCIRDSTPTPTDGEPIVIPTPTATPDAGGEDGNTFTTVISQSKNDVEERGDTFFQHSADLDFDPETVVALRYFVCLPGLATITEASLTFTAADENINQATAIQIYAEAALEPVDFLKNPSIANRERTDASVGWDLPVLGEDDLVATTPDISPLLNELTDIYGHNGCGYVVLVLETTSGDQNYVAFDADPANAAVLTITYEVEG